MTLVIRQSVLRKALVTQAVLGSTLGAFWSTLALMLTAPPFSLGASAAGAFGLAGVAGAFGAPLFGGFADRRGPTAAIRLGWLLVAAAFTLMLLEPQSIAALILGAVLFDHGVMAGLVSHQTIVTSIDPAARSRLNGLLMTAAMIGMSLGAVAGGWAWQHCRLDWGLPHRRDRRPARASALASSAQHFRSFPGRPPHDRFASALGRCPCWFLATDRIVLFLVRARI